MSYTRRLIIISALAGSLAASRAAYSDETGFALEAFRPGYPATTMTYEGEVASQLAGEVLPVVADQTKRAMVYETVMLPMGVYQGLVFEFVLAPRVVNRSLCEEPHAFVHVRYPSMSYPIEMKLNADRGSVPGHSIDYIQWRGRYRSLPDEPATPEAALDACRKLAVDTSGWKQAADQYEFRSHERMLVMLMEAAKMARPPIECVDIERKPCTLTRADLVSVLERTPPDDVRTLYVPGDGEVMVYRFTERPTGATGVATGKSYSITMRWMPDGKQKLHFAYALVVTPAV